LWFKNQNLMEPRQLEQEQMEQGLVLELLLEQGLEQVKVQELKLEQWPVLEQ